MLQKISIIFFFLVIFFSQACYTITHPDPCPGLIDNQDLEEEFCVDF